MLWQRSVTLTASTNVADILSSIQGYPYVASYNQAVTIALNLSAQTGQFADVIVAQRIFAENIQPNAANRWPLNPDDFLLGPYPMLRGEQLKIPIRETAAATPTLFIAILSNP
jgi:hypothetical protein